MCVYENDRWEISVLKWKHDQKCWLVLCAALKSPPASQSADAITAFREEVTVFSFLHPFICFSLFLTLLLLLLPSAIMFLSARCAKRLVTQTQFSSKT